MIHSRQGKAGEVPVDAWYQVPSLSRVVACFVEAKYAGALGAVQNRRLAHVVVAGFQYYEETDPMLPGQPRPLPEWTVRA